MKTLLALAIAAGCTGDGGGDVTGVEPAGTIRVTIISGTSRVPAIATVQLAGPVRRITTVESGAILTFADLPPGIYTIGAAIQSYICQSVSANLSAGETTNASILCVHPGSVTGRVIRDDEDTSVGNAFVSLTSRKITRGTSGGDDGYFTFHELLPGIYTLKTSTSGMDCPLLYVDVHPAETTKVLVRCMLPPPSPSEVPRGSQIQGPWWYYRTLETQTGDCPRPLPATAVGSMSFDPGNRAISIVGLDPALRIVGAYDTQRGTFTGFGRAVRGDGSTVQTELTGGFLFAWWGYGGTADPTTFSTGPSGAMLRTHQDASGRVTCIEAYQSSGDR